MGVDEDSMENPTSIDDILSDAPEAPSEPQVETPQPETIGQPRDDHGRFAAKEMGEEEPQETPAEPVPPTEQPSQQEQGQFAALKDERRKRQALEQQLAEMQQKFSQSPQQQEQAPADFWDDPQAFMARQFNQFGEQFRQQIRQEQQVERIDASEAVARSKYADYDDAFHAFRQAVETNPALAAQMMQANDPAEFAYRKGKTALDLERVGSIDELIKTERAKWEQEARAAIPPAPTFPSTTATDGSVGARSGPTWTGPRSIGDILGG